MLKISFCRLLHRNAPIIRYVSKFHRLNVSKSTYSKVGLLSFSTWIAWCSSEQSEDLQKDESFRSPTQFWYVCKDRVVNSSTFRFGRAAYAVVGIFIDYKYSLSGLNSSLDEYKLKKSECHLRSANRLKNLCISNGGVFMKVGQHVGSLDFLLPVEYTSTLKCFQYNAPESPYEDIRYVIETDTLHSMDELFLSFDKKPIGSASLAQVHVATLKSGENVAVKVQHKSVKEHALQDAKVIEFFVDVASKAFPEFKFQWLVDQIKANLPLELDFINEGKNCEKMRDYLTRFRNISVPEIHWDFSTKRVLFMEYIVGGAVDDIDYIKKNDLRVSDISTLLGDLYSEMIFVHGDVHCDPHAGNIMVRKSKNKKGVELILLDHGLYIQMDNRVRLMYAKLWQSMLERDIEGIKTYGKELGVGEYYGIFACMVAGRSWESIQSGIDKKNVSSDELNEIQSGAVEFAAVITDVLEKMPRELVMVFKTNDLLRGLDARLKTSAASASFITMTKSCLRAVYNADLKNCHSMRCGFVLYFQYKWSLFRIVLYQFSLSFEHESLYDVVSICRNSILSLLDSINNIPRLIAGR